MGKLLISRRNFGNGRHRGASVSREIASVVLVAIVLSWLLKTFLVQAFFIPSGSMEETLRVGDRIVVDKLAPGPKDLKRGDVVVFHDPGGWLNETASDGRSPLSPIYDGLEFLGLVPVRSGDDLVKRVIGVAGDDIECAGPGQPILVNKVPLDEDAYLFPGAAPSDVAFKVHVPPGRLWVMGDHRNDSADSRAHITLAPDFGMVPIDNVVGRAAGVVWPLGHMTRLHRPDTFDNPALAPGKAS